MKIFSFIVFSMACTFAIHGQSLEDELGFKYVKAEYLFGTERYEDAIKELNDIIKSNPNFKNALLVRAESKYKLAAYKGAKSDALLFIDQIGITKEAATILGKSEYSLQNMEAALNSLSAAISMGTKDDKVFEMRADIWSESGQMLKACADWEAGAILGSTNAAIMAKKNCGYEEVKVDDRKVVEETNPLNSNAENDTAQNDTSDDNGSKQEEVISDGVRNDEASDNSTKEDTEKNDTVNEVNSVPADSNIPEEDDTQNRFVVDEDLTISIYGQGLGNRKILDKPSILILSEENGVVAVEICVNRNGSVDYAEFNSKISTLSKKSLVSLAIRKAKEFWFEKSDFPKQCGFILFEVKGS